MVNKESRGETLLYYRVLFQSDAYYLPPYPEYLFWFNPLRDTLYVLYDLLKRTNQHWIGNQWLDYVDSQLHGGIGCHQEFRDPGHALVSR
jgi:hypothetical protein